MEEFSSGLTSAILFFNFEILIKADEENQVFISGVFLWRWIYEDHSVKLPAKVSSQGCNCPAQPQFCRKLGFKYPIPPLSCPWSLELVLVTLVG